MNNISSYNESVFYGVAKTYLWPDINKVDFSKCQRCHKRKSPIYDKRYKSSISCICKKCLKEFYG